MDNIVYEAIKRYFKTLSSLGYESYDDVYKLLYMICILDFVYNDFKGYITEEDYTIIQNSIYCIFGSTCLIPYPQFCKSKNIMGRLHLGSISELAYMVKHNQEVVDNYTEDIKNKVDDYQQQTDNKVTEIKEITAQYKEDTDTVINKYKEDINTSEALFNQEMNEKVSAYKEDIDNSEYEYQENMKSIVKDHKSDTDKSVSDYYNKMDSKVDEYKSKVDEYKHDVVDDMASIKAVKVIKGHQDSVEISDIEI